MLLPKPLTASFKYTTIIIFFLVGLLFSGDVNAQADTLKAAQIAVDSAGLPYTKVDIQAKFPGGPDVWRMFLEKNIRPKTPIKNNAPPGLYTVLVSFIVDTSGNVSDVRIDKDPGYGCAEDVLHLFKKSPRWVPAVLKGRNVVYRQKQSISYQVD